MRYKKGVHEALLKIADENIDYLSYEGQTKWNDLTKKFTEKKVEKP